MYEQSIWFPLCSTAPNDSHRLWRICSVQPVNRNKIFFLISEDEQVCRHPQTLISLPLLWSAVECLFWAQPAWLPYKLPAKLPRVMELSVAWSCTLVAITVALAGDITPVAQFWLVGKKWVGTVLIRMKTCAHIFKGPENMPCVLMPERAEDLISLQHVFKRGFSWGYLTFTALHLFFLKLEVLGPGWTKNSLVWNNLFCRVARQIVLFYLRLFFVACLWYYGVQ